MHRGHAILAVLVLAASVWAYLVAHPLGGGAPSGEGTATVWQVPERDVRSVALREGMTDVTLQPRWPADAKQPTVWIRDVIGPAPEAKPAGEAKPGANPKQGGEPKPAAAPAHKAPAKAPKGGNKAPAAKQPAPPQARPKRTTQEFRGNADAQATLADLATLHAQRALGRLASLDAKELGFPAPHALIELQRKTGAPLKLELGRATYGDQQRYVHNPADDQVYLLPMAILRRLVTASNSLMDRDLLALRPEQAQRLELRSGEAHRSFYRLAGPNRWGTSPAAASENTEVGTLVTQLGRLRVLHYRSLDEPAPAGPPALEVRLFATASDAQAQPAAWLRLYGSKGDVTLAVSSHTERPVELPAPLVKPLLEKARSLLHGT